MASELAPLPGDPVALKSKADALSTAAQQIQQAIDHLRKLADRGDTVSDAVDKVRSKASDVANNITKAHVRYLGTAQALQEYAPKLEAAQQRAAKAIAAHGSAQQAVSDAQTSLQHQSVQYQHDQANQPAAATSSTPPTAFSATPAGVKGQQAVSDANDAVSAAISEYNAAKAEVDAAAQTAISKIDSAIGDSDLNDSFWDRLKNEVSHLASDAMDWAKKYLAPVLDVIQKIAAAIVDIGSWVSMILNVLAVFIPVLAPIAAAVDIIVLAAAAVSFVLTAALVVLGDRTLGDLLNTGISLVASALPIKADASILKGAKGMEGMSKVATKLTSGNMGKAFDAAEKLGAPLEKAAGFVGKRGAAFADKTGVTFLDRFASNRGSDYAAAAFHGVLEHGGSIEQAGAQSVKQYAHGVAEFNAAAQKAFTDGATGLGHNVTNSAIGAGIVSATNVAGAGFDKAWDGLGMPGHDYFQHHSAVEIPALVPSIGVAGLGESTWGGLDPVNVVKANAAMNLDVPIAVGRALTGTAHLD